MGVNILRLSVNRHSRYLKNIFSTNTKTHPNEIPEKTARTKVEALDAKKRRSNDRGEQQTREG